MDSVNFSSAFRDVPSVGQTAATSPATPPAAQQPAFADFKGGYDTIGSRADQSMNELGRMLEGLGDLAESLGHR